MAHHTEGTRLQFSVTPKGTSPRSRRRHSIWHNHQQPQQCRRGSLLMAGTSADSASRETDMLTVRSYAQGYVSSHRPPAPCCNTYLRYTTEVLPRPPQFGAASPRIPSSYPMQAVCPIENTVATHAAQCHNNHHTPIQLFPESERFNPVEGVIASLRNAQSSDDASRSANNSSAILSDSTNRLGPAREAPSMVTKHVHWVAGSDPVIPSGGRGSMCRSLWVPQYNRNIQTTPFNVQVKFGDDVRIIPFGPVTMAANILFEFENRLVRQVPVNQRKALRMGMENGYAIVFSRKGLKKWTPVHIRGTHILHPNAAFTGFLNSVPEGANVVLEWH
jgi:hypothetical protein